jgi:hypothetical protein|tara:strand:+ start:145 stop:402 length:258 start_codon:yes stop_codon:yes gene_type:complete
MKTNDKPFLHSYTNNLEIGDLVWWTEWDRDGDFKYVSNVYRGVLINFKVTMRIGSERPVVVAIVLPYGSTKTRELEPHLIKKDTN